VSKSTPAPQEYPLRWTVDEYFGLVHRGVLCEDDRVELLDGLIVAMSPQDPPHAVATAQVYEALLAAVAGRAAVRSQLPLILGQRWAPEPDVAVVPGATGDYGERHPRTAILVVEIADSSLAQDRLTKAAVYARFGIPEYWVVNLRDDRVEVYREPGRKRGPYRKIFSASRGEHLELVALPGASVAVDDLLPRRRSR
jgi:Uma2 family endonuclease